MGARLQRQPQKTGAETVQRVQPRLKWYQAYPSAATRQLIFAASRLFGGPTASASHEDQVFSGATLLNPYVS